MCFSSNQTAEKSSLRTRGVQIALYLLATSLVGPYQRADGADPVDRDRPMISPAEAISRLKEGNGRFIAGNVQHPHKTSDERAYIAKSSYENHGVISC